MIRMCLNQNLFVGPAVFTCFNLIAFALEFFFIVLKFHLTRVFTKNFYLYNKQAQPIVGKELLLYKGIMCLYKIKEQPCF